MLYSDDVNILSEYVDPSAIEYDDELDRYAAYFYNGLFVTKQEYEGYATALDERIIFQSTPMLGFTITRINRNVALTHNLLHREWRQ